MKSINAPLCDIRAILGCYKGDIRAILGRYHTAMQCIFSCAFNCVNMNFLFAK